ncbi:hypothetical protein AURDEDRAFT_155998 [Auricularia subglabra TFB-10046 SS5]|nr:hypothetical protein AURDEDRAFT_155998 [Auricularia subglabra TFB-10046 SS5]
MEKLPVELLEKVISYVNASELSAIRRARRQGKQRGRSNILSLRFVCRTFSRIAAQHLFSRCTIAVYPDHGRLREFCIFAQSYIAPHIRSCIFRADELLVRFPPDRLNVSLMNSAALCIRKFAALEHLHLDFATSECCRASGQDWIDQRPHIVARIFADLDDTMLQSLNALVLRISAEEFMKFTVLLEPCPPGSNHFLRRLRHLSLHINLMCEARYVPSAAPAPSGGYTTSFAYVPEARYEDDTGFCAALGRTLGLCPALATLDLRLLNSELVAPAAFSSLLHTLHFPSLARLAISHIPAYVTALVVFLSRHETSLRYLAMDDLDLRADREPAPALIKQLHFKFAEVDPDASGPWVPFCAYAVGLAGLKCAVAVSDPNTWTTPLVPAEHVAIAELERRMLERAREENMSEADLRQDWMFRVAETHCSHCGKPEQRYEIAAGVSQ